MGVDVGVAVMSTLKPLYGDREARNIAKYLIPEFVFLSGLDLQKALRRLANKEPWQYVIGKEWFYDLELQVNEHTLIPRPETEELVYRILQQLGGGEKKVLDIGTGTGCIALALKSKRTSWSVSACDVSASALDVARKNAFSNQLEVDFFQEDILNPQHSDEPSWDVIVSNPPYIPMREKELMSSHVLDYEPHSALFVEDDDPLIFYRKIGEYALQNLKPSGWLFFELNEFHADATRELIQKLGFQQVEVVLDLMEKPRMLQAQKA